jgi:hypothetical protein
MAILAYWGISALVLIACAGLVGRRASYFNAKGEQKPGGMWLGILIDDRERFSLTHLQTVLWALVFLSLLIAIFLARLIGGADPLSMAIPPQILGLVGISGGSAVIATAAKSPRTEAVRAKAAETRFSQIFMEENGLYADKVIDVTKFQNFFLTIIAVVAYVVMAASKLSAAGSADQIGFPGFGSELLWLIGISHAAYLGGKLPAKA